MQAYHNMVRTILSDGVDKGSRGAATISKFCYTFRHDMGTGFPLMTTKKMPWKSIVLENLWFLSGENNISGLQKHGVQFWDKWANEQNTIDSPYGMFWRNFNGVDQLKTIIESLKKNPESRRHVITAWDPYNVASSSLPPCHIMLIFHTEKGEHGYKLNLHVTQRSADVAIGVPFNIAGYGLILNLIARFTGMEAKELAITFVDAHIYAENEYDHRPGLRKQLQRKDHDLPQIEIDEKIQSLEDCEKLWKEGTTEEIMNAFKLVGYVSHPAIQFEVLV